MKILVILVSTILVSFNYQRASAKPTDLKPGAYKTASPSDGALQNLENSRRLAGVLEKHLFAQINFYESQDGNGNRMSHRNEILTFCKRISDRLIKVEGFISDFRIPSQFLHAQSPFQKDCEKFEKARSQAEAIKAINDLGLITFYLANPDKSNYYAKTKKLIGEIEKEQAAENATLEARLGSGDVEGYQELGLQPDGRTPISGQK
jgi:hypothetical protein